MKQSIIIAFGLIGFFLFNNSLFGQDESSFYFTEPQPSTSQNVTEILGEITGEYTRDENTRVQFFVTKDSVFCRFPVIMALSVAEIESEGQFEIKGTEIFGVREGEGLPVRIFNDTAVFIHFQHELVFTPDKNHIMKKEGGVYFLNYKEPNGMWTTTALSLRGEDLYLHSLDHTRVMADLWKFEDFKKIEEPALSVYTAAPTKEQLLSFYNSYGFKDKIKYIRKN